MPVKPGFTPTVAELEKRDRIPVAISQAQAATEQHLHEQIERKDVNALLDYAQFAAERVSEDHLRNLLFAMLQTDDRVWGFMMSQIRGHSRLMHAALDDLADDLEKQRAAFMEFAALQIIKGAQP